MATISTLTTGSGSGTQTTTQDPQLSGTSSSFSAAQNSSVQPGTTSSLLAASQGGIPLQITALPSVSLAAASTTTAQPAAPKPTHSIHPLLFGISGLLLVVAVVMFWSTTRAAKNTTN